MKHDPSDAKRESRSVDFKRSFDPTSAGDWCEMVKDFVAFANSGGGTILVGVENNGTVSGEDVSAVLGIDPATFTDKIAKYTSVQFSDIGVAEASREGHPIAKITIGPSRSPIVFSSPGTYAVSEIKQKTAFGIGTLYVRHGAKSEPATSSDLSEIIERQLQSVRKEWMAGVRKVVNAPPHSIVSVLPAEVTVSNAPDAAPVRITSDSSAPAYRIVDPDVTHPWRQKELIAEVNKSVRPEHAINQFHIKALRHLYSIDDNPQYFHKSRFSAPQYSPALASWALEHYVKDTSFFSKAREEFMSRSAIDRLLG